jgi:hypothetical protein
VQSVADDTAICDSRVRVPRVGVSRFIRLIALIASVAVSTAVLAEEIVVRDARIEVQFAPTPPDALRPLVHRWVENAAQAVAGYYGRFPVETVNLRISPQPGHRVTHGETFGWPRARIKISVGTATTALDFNGDWRLTHEMVHLALPSLGDSHHWLEEGIATYVEPIARARAGFLTAEQVWGDLVDGLPQGLPKAGDQGLDRTPTWGRTYWGGALFCLRADVEIRRRTQNRYGLEHALRAILTAGDIRQDWPIARVISVGDTATGVLVLHELYDQMAAQPVSVDLPELWRQLGVIHHGNVTTFDDHAPLTAIRRAITAPSLAE